MKLLQRRKEGRGKALFKLYGEDWEVIDASASARAKVNCMICNQPASHYLKELKEDYAFCLTHKGLLTQLWLPLDHPRVVLADEARKARLQLNPNTGRVKQVKLTQEQKYKLVLANAVGMGHVTYQDMIGICDYWGLRLKVYDKLHRELRGTPNEELVKAFRQGKGKAELEAMVTNTPANNGVKVTTLLTLPEATSYKALDSKLKEETFGLSKEDYYYYNTAVFEVLEGRNLQEVAEEFELDGELLKRIVEAESKEEPEDE